MRHIPNKKIAEILFEIGEFLAMQKIQFKPRAYEKAAQAVADFPEELSELYEQGGLKALRGIDNVGESIAEKIEELFKTGKLEYYEKLKAKTPVNLEELSLVEGLGPSGIKKLHEKLGIRNLSDLKKAAEEGKIREVEGFGERTEQNILKSIGFIGKSQGRFILGLVMPRIRSLEDFLRKIPGVDKVTVAGSVRRRKETVGDADVLVLAKYPDRVMESFISMPDVARIIARGDTKSSVKLRSGLNVDVRIVPQESYGAALNYFTGSKDHNVTLREIAIQRGCKLNEYGLWRGEKQVAGRTEEDLYKALGLSYIEPEMRENKGEIELSRSGKLPDLIGYDELHGDLQMHTDWTDGSLSIREMAEAAYKKGLKYIAITDHTKRLAMTGGLDEKRLLLQMAEIDKVNREMAGKITVLKGTECDILKDGALDLPDSILSKLDIVGVSVHSYFNLSRADQTERVIRAIRNPHVDILFHPTGRLLEKRDACDLDVDKVIETARKTGTILEIDAYPDRLDLKDDYVRKCVQEGVKLSIDSDAHASAHFSFLEYGIAQARRGWASREDVINAWPLSRMLKSLKRNIHGKDTSTTRRKTSGS